MWLLVLLIGIKMQMPTAFWILFTIITILRPIIGLYEHSLCDVLMNKK